MTNYYDVIIVGAGPAGCELARQISKTNLKVLLTDRVKDFNENNFSSAATPISFFQEFNIDESVIGSKCNKFTLGINNQQKTWNRNSPTTVVMDFAKLRKFLSDKAKARGVEIRFGLEYLEYKEIEKVDMEVVFKNVHNQQKEKLFCRVLVDATGSTRSIMDKFNNYNKVYSSAVGLEYLIETNENLGENNLKFLIGSKYISSGYIWQFPMGENKYKIGACCYTSYYKKRTGHDKIELKKYIEKYIHLSLNLDKSRYTVLDIHGGGAIPNLLHKDVYSYKNVLAIGDAVSSIHMLGGEGIRYSMRNAHIASKYIQSYFQGDDRSFKKYKKKARRYLRGKYLFTNLISVIIYRYLNNRLFSLVFRVASKARYDEMMNILFENDYSLKTLLKLLFRKN
jgi:flavin-dependent dehydrogenase